jgi:hypothetical protein
MREVGRYLSIPVFFAVVVLTCRHGNNLKTTDWTRKGTSLQALACILLVCQPYRRGFESHTDIILRKSGLLSARSLRTKPWDITRDLMECLAPFGRRPIRVSANWLEHHFYWLVISVQREDAPTILPFLAFHDNGVPPPVYRYKSWCWGDYVMVNAHNYLACITSGLCLRRRTERAPRSPVFFRMLGPIYSSISCPFKRTRWLAPGSSAGIPDQGSFPISIYYCGHPLVIKPRGGSF